MSMRHDLHCGIKLGESFGMEESIIDLARSMGIKCAAFKTESVYQVSLGSCSALEHVLSMTSAYNKRVSSPVKYEPVEYSFKVSMHDIGDYIGITLEEDSDHLFLLANNTVVHNCNVYVPSL